MIKASLYGTDSQKVIVEGLIDGMKEYEKTQLTLLKSFDYVAFNETAIQEFEELFK